MADSRGRLLIMAKKSAKKNQSKANRRAQQKKQAPQRSLEQQKAAEKARRDKALQKDMAERRAAMLQDGAMLVVLAVVFAVRGLRFDSLGQILAIGMSWLLGLLIVDLYYLARRLESPHHWTRRFLPACGVGILVFLGFVAIFN